jgi:hypothetical protein
MECFECGEMKGVHNYFSHAPPTCRACQKHFFAFEVTDEAKLDELAEEARGRGVRVDVASVAMAKKLIAKLYAFHPDDVRVNDAGCVVFQWSEPRVLELEVEAVERGFWVRPWGLSREGFEAPAAAKERIREIIMAAGDRGIP